VKNRKIFAILTHTIIPGENSQLKRADFTVVNLRCQVKFFISLCQVGRFATKGLVHNIGLFATNCDYLRQITAIFEQYGQFMPIRRLERQFGTTNEFLRGGPRKHRFLA
jgi:hypothetical protein